MSWPTSRDLRVSETRLRSYDNALRLRFSREDWNTVLIERKTFCGRIGSTGPGGLLWRPDSGRRREEGHVLVGSLPAAAYETDALLDALKYADTWQKWDLGAKPLWQRVEESDAVNRTRILRTRQEGLRYKASNLYDRYVWRYKQRVAVPARIA